MKSYYLVSIVKCEELYDNSYKIIFKLQRATFMRETTIIIIVKAVQGAPGMLGIGVLHLLD